MDFRATSAFWPTCEDTAASVSITLRREAISSAGDGNTRFERDAGALNLDMTATGRVPAADRQVTGQVLVPHCLTAYGRHLGLWQTDTKQKRLKVLEFQTWSSLLQADVTAATDLQPHILGSGGDGRDLKGCLAVLGDQFAGVHVVFGGQFRLDAHSHPVGGAPVGVGHLDLKRGGAKLMRELRCRRVRPESDGPPSLCRAGRA